VLAVPLAYAAIKLASLYRGVEVNQWRVSFSTGDFGHNYLLRAAVAVYSLGNAIPQEALFFHGFRDGDGQTLNGRDAYTITFAEGQLPPVNAFWSLTAYKADDSYLAHNAIARYSISPRTPGVTFAADGSLTFHIRHNTPPPSADGQANWLPVPTGDFSTTLRTYMPRSELLSLQWKPPAIRRVAGGTAPGA
jgi:hypothetical protein